MTISKLGSIGYSYIPEEGPRSFYGVTMAKYSDTFSKGSSASIRTRSRPSYIMPVYVSWQPASAPTKCNAHQHPSEFHLKGTWSRERGVIKQRERNAEINTYMKIRKLLRHLMIFSRGFIRVRETNHSTPSFSSRQHPYPYSSASYDIRRPSHLCAYEFTSILALCRSSLPPTPPLIL